MSQNCPNCKLEMEDENLAVCPGCRWDLNNQVDVTLQPAETDRVPVVSIQSMPSIAELTLDRPGSPSDRTAHGITVSFSLDEKKLEFDSDLQSDTRQSGPNDVTLPPSSDDTESILLTGTAGGSIKTVIPVRSIAKDSEPGKLQDYQLVKPIGSGSFGVVFQAKQLPLDRTVALKVLTSGDSRTADQVDKIQIEFLREAQFTGKLEHPNIVPIHDIGLAIDDRTGVESPFYVMKEIHGVSWMRTIRKNSRIENLEIFKRVVDAIGFAHDKNVLHCDLKPENVMLGQFGEVLLVDWGQAIDLSRPETIRPGGTPAYISPEMATFWCDLYLDRKTDSPARIRVDRGSDVYLLGAILFEIVTGKLPREANVDEGESQFDVMRRACRNEIQTVAGWDNDELMEIARRAMRVSNAPPIHSISELQNELKTFETRVLSIDLRRRGDQLLNAAIAENSYDSFQKAKLSYEESLETWDGNAAAKKGLEKSRFRCAELALTDQNFDLGIDVLADPKTGEEKDLHQALQVGKTKRDRRQRLVRWLAAGLVASMVAGIAVNGFMIRQNLESVKLRDQALKQKSIIEQQIEPLQADLLENQAIVAASEQQIQQFPARLKQEQEKFANDLDLEKQKFESELATERQVLASTIAAEREALASRLAAERAASARQIVAEQQRTAVVKQEFSKEIDTLGQQLNQLDESSQILRTKAAVSNVRQKLQSGNFREARELLNAFPDKQTWEWSRLSLLSHREVESLYPDDPLISVGASGDGSRLALAFPDRVEIRDVTNLSVVVATIPEAGVSAVGLSTTGTRLAVGIPGNEIQKTGKILVLNVSDNKNIHLHQQLDGQSNSIGRVAFSDDGTRVLSVGVPSKIRKSAGGLEAELMVWEGGIRMSFSLADSDGASPLFSDAMFSTNGKRILTFHPHGLGRDQFLNLFIESNQAFRWATRTPVANLNCAIFSPNETEEIVACYQNMKTGGYSLVRWTPELGRQNQSDRNPVSVGVSDAAGTAVVDSSSISNVAPLAQKILHFDRAENWLLTGGEDHRVTRWNWLTKSSDDYRGHTRNVDYCKLIPNQTSDKQLFVSIASGAAPEILKTDLQTYRPEFKKQPIASYASDDKPSPTCFFYSEKTHRSVFGNDQAQAAIRAQAAVETSERVVDKTNVENDANIDQDSVQWEVSAWKNHFLTDAYLFAQSRGDLFYQFDQSSGRLERVLTKLSKNRVTANNRRAEIVVFDVSADGTRAVVVTDAKSNEFEIWDLANERQLRKIDYAERKIFGSVTDKELLQVKISPDGKWIVAGKVGLFAWSTETGEQVELHQSAVERARTSVSAIQFIAGTTQVLASWKGRIDLIDLTGNQPLRRFSITGLSDQTNEPNLLDCVNVDGQLLVLVRVSDDQDQATGIALYDLNNKRRMRTFATALDACFSRFHPAEVLVLQSDAIESTVVRYHSITNASERLDLDLPDDIDTRFRFLTRVSESTEAVLIVQAMAPNPLNPVRGNWNTVSIETDGKIGELTVLAKPKIDDCGIAGSTAVTLDSGNLRFWKVADHGVSPIGIFSNRCRTMAISPNEKWLAAVSENGNQIFILSAETQKTIAGWSHASPAPITTLTWSAASSQLVVGTENGTVEVWDWDGQQARKTQTLASIPSSSAVSQIKISQSGTTVLTLYRDAKKVRVSHFNAEPDESGKQWVSYLLGHDDGQRLVAGDLAPDGRRFISGSDRGRVTVWNTEPFSKTSGQGAADEMLEFGSEREIFNLQNQHRSPIRFLKFVENSQGELEVVSAEEDSGENEIIVWPVTKPAVDGSSRPIGASKHIESTSFRTQRPQ